jgi:hypothetical protein
MGISYSVYVGRFINLTDKTVLTTIKKKFTTCCNKHCKNYSKALDGKYCNMCGEHLLYVDTDATVRIYDIINKELAATDNDYWIDRFSLFERPTTIAIEGMYTSSPAGQILQHNSIEPNDGFKIIKSILDKYEISYSEEYCSFGVIS